MSSKYRIIPFGGGGGGITPTGTLDIRSEGVFDVSRYASVDVDIFDDTTTKRITNNGTYNASADHVLGYSQVTVDVPNGTETVTITENGTYTPTSPNIGFSEVAVNVTGPVYEPDYLCFTTDEGQAFFYLDVSGANVLPNLEYSRDRVNWITWDYSQLTLNDWEGKTVYLRGYNPTGISDYSHGTCKFVTPGGWINASGDIGTLLRYDEPVDYAIGFQNLFESCINLKTPPRLPATVLYNACYYQMFDGSGITTLPSLPATVLYTNCYQYMFRHCQIESIPQNYLPATTLANNCYDHMFSGTPIESLPSGLLPATTMKNGCYGDMFSNCQQLTSIPSWFLPATNLASMCYRSIFNGCRNLTSVPSGLLPATTLAQNCYQYLFANCTSLTTVPDDLLPATTSVYGCYEKMFQGCTSLAATPTIKCSPNASWSFQLMFDGCSSLTRITTMSTSWNTTNAQNWVQGVASRGDFYNLGGASISRGTSGIPSNWTIHTTIE